MNKVLCESCLKLIPCRKASTRFSLPWLNRLIKRLYGRKQSLYKVARQSNQGRNWMVYRKLKKNAKKFPMNLKNSYLSSLLDDITKCMKKFQTFVKSKKKAQFGITVLEHLSKVCTDSLSKANLRNNHFAAVFTHEDFPQSGKFSSGIISLL